MLVCSHAHELTSGHALKSMNLRKLLGTLAGILISVLFLAIALYQVNFNAITSALAHADYRLVAFSAVFTFLSYVFRTARWALFLKPQKKIPLVRLFPVLVIGFALNNLLPGRPGEFARAISLGQREGLPKTMGLATVVVERVVDGLTLVAILAFLSLGFELPGWGRVVATISVSIFAVALAGLLFLLWREELATRLFAYVMRFLPPRIAQRLNQMLSSFILGLRALRSPREVLAIALLSFCIWFCEATQYWIVLTAFGLLSDVRARTLAAAFTMVAANLSIAIPAAPGGLGPFEGAGILALGAFGLAKEQSLPAVLVAHLGVQYLLVTVLGVFFIAREGIKLTQAVDEEEPALGRAR